MVEQDAPLKKGDGIEDLLGSPSNPRAPRDTGADARRSRDADDRTVTERRDLSDDERIEMFRTTFFNDVLPDVPDIPGYHVCWLSTTHPTDTIPRRLRLGYELIKATDIPGYESASLKTGEYAGCIGVNEMVAAKLPMHLWEAFMQEAHHNAPAREDEIIAQKIDRFHEDAARDKGKIIEEDGMQDLRRSAPPRGRFSQ